MITVQKLVQSLALIIANNSKRTPADWQSIHIVNDFFHFQEIRIKELENRLKEVERRTYNLEVDNSKKH